MSRVSIGGHWQHVTEVAKYKTQLQSGSTWGQMEKGWLCTKRGLHVLLLETKREDSIRGRIFSARAYHVNGTELSSRQVQSFTYSWYAVFFTGADCNSGKGLLVVICWGKLSVNKGATQYFAGVRFHIFRIYVGKSIRKLQIQVAT
jgi:hypothetical protein